MKKILNTAFFYLILGLVSGVFYREFTKIYGYTNYTRLSVLHTHLLTLGMIIFMIIFLIASIYNKLIETKKFTIFYFTYNISFLVMIITVLIRGILEVLNINLNKSFNTAISGIAGLSHIGISVALIILFLELKKQVYNK